MAAEMWLRQRGVWSSPTARFNVEIALAVVDERAPTEFDEQIATRFHLEIYSEEWGIFFCHGGKSSWVRVTDVPFVRRRDDFQLLAVLPPLKDVGQLLHQLERSYKIQFQRQHAAIRTNLAGAEVAVRSWLATL